MAKSQSLASMSVDALLKLRDDIGSMLSKKAVELQRQLVSLTGSASGGSGKRRGRPPGKSNSLKGLKVAPKYRGPGDETWAGRGATPRWMAEAVKGGAKKEDFLVAGTATVLISRQQRNLVPKGRRPSFRRAQPSTHVRCYGIGETINGN